MTPTAEATPASELPLPLVVAADAIAAEGLERLRSVARVVSAAGDPALLQRLLPRADALLVRSETRVTAALLAQAPRLRVVARAGAGIDTIDVAACTARGVVVSNTPGGNAVAAAEQALALLFAVARRVAAADASMKAGQWQRSRFVGQELTGKTLGLLGFGRVGREVALRAHGLQMHVLVYDPFVRAEHIQQQGYAVRELEALLAEADVLSLHTPLTEQTHGLLDAARLSQTKRGAVLINCARGELVDPTALLAALESGQLGGAGLDVWAAEPVPTEDARLQALVRHPRVVATPHLGASTIEAQTQVAVLAAEEVRAVLADQPAQFALNAPRVPAEAAARLRPWLVLGRRLGRLAQGLSGGRAGGLEVRYGGELAEQATAAVGASVVQGLLEPVSAEGLTLVNAPLVAAQRGLSVAQTTRRGPAGQYTSLLEVAVQAEDGRRTEVAGTLSGEQPVVVGLLGYAVHLPAQAGYLLLTQHQDQPGVIGLVGTRLGQADINISSMQVGRAQPRGPALMVLQVDEPVPPQVVATLTTLPNVHSVHVVSL